MKNIILILCLCFCTLSFGRHVLQSRLHLPRPGDEIIKQQIYMSLHPFGEYVLNVWLDGYRVIESKVLKR